MASPAPARRGNGMSASTAWQSPQVNVFKHYDVVNGSRCSKRGDVTMHIDKVLKKRVFKIHGSVPAANCIQIPKAASQSLGLIGTQLYIVFRALGNKHFVMHFDVGTDTGIVVRVSVSNLYKEFKATSTWLQFPFLDTSRKWTLLHLDVAELIRQFTRCRFYYIKGMQFSGNLLVRTTISTSIKYSTPESLPRDIRFQLSQDEIWQEKYDYLAFPAPTASESGFGVPYNTSGGKNTAAPMTKHVTKDDGGAQHLKPNGNQNNVVKENIVVQEEPSVLTDPRTAVERAVELHPVLIPKAKVKQSMALPHTFSVVRHNRASKETPSGRVGTTNGLPQVGLDLDMLNPLTDQSNILAQTARVNGTKGTTISMKDVKSKAGNTRRQIPSKTRNHDLPSAHSQSNLSRDAGHAAVPNVIKQSSQSPPSRKPKAMQTISPDPIVDLESIVGYTPLRGAGLIWQDEQTLVYSCGRSIIKMDTTSRYQKFLRGHTATIVAMSKSAGSLLVTAQAGKSPAIRIWSLTTDHCICIVGCKQRIQCVSLSQCGSVLAVTGKDSSGRQLVTLWDCTNVVKSMKITLLAKSNVEADIAAFEIAPTDLNRMVSCGRDNIRIWRVRHGVLRSCPVDLSTFHRNPVMLGSIAWSSQTPDSINAFVATSAGELFEVDCLQASLMAVHRVHDESLNCTRIANAIGVTGGGDNILRVWPLDFSESFLEANHDAPVVSIGISPDGLKIASGTKSGCLGYLDVQSKKYTTVMRSHMKPVLAVAYHSTRSSVATMSEDGFACVWRPHPPIQLCQFKVDNDVPVSGVFHPEALNLVCGYESGAVRMFDVEETSMRVSRHNHSARVSHVMFSSDGDSLFSAGEDGLLVLYDGMQDFCATRIINFAPPGPISIALNDNSSRLAYSGPDPLVITVIDATTLEEVTCFDLPIQGRKLNSNGASSQQPKLKQLVFDSSASQADLYALTTEGRLTLLDSKFGEALSHASLGSQQHVGFTGSVVFKRHPARRFLVSSGGSSGQALQIFHPDLNSLDQSQIFLGHNAVVHDFAFSPDGNDLVSVGDAIYFWKIAPVLVNDSPEEVGDLQHEHPQVMHRKEGEESGHSQSDSKSSRIEMNNTNSIEEDGIRAANTPNSVRENEHYSDANRRSQASQPNSDFQMAPAPVPEPLPQLHDGWPTVGPLSLASAIDLEAHPTSQEQPLVHSHYGGPTAVSKLAEKRYTVTEDQEGMSISHVLGHTPRGRSNVFWHAQTGLFVYSNGPRVVVEDLGTREQKIFSQHVEEIGTIAVQSDGIRIASAASPSVTTENLAQICIWHSESGICLHSLLYHTGEIGCLAFSPDDKLLLSVGNYSDNTIALWEVETGTIISAALLDSPVNQVAWDPASSAREFATVGQNATLSFWVLNESADESLLNVHTAAVPEQLLSRHFTSISYADDCNVLVGDNVGTVSTWDTRANECIASWSIGSTEVVRIDSGNGKVILGGVRSLSLWTVRFEDSADSDQENDSMVLEDEIFLDGSVTSMSFDAVFAMGMVATAAGSIWYVNWPEGSTVRLASGHNRPINSLAISKSDVFLASGGADGTVRIWSNKNHEQAMQFQVTDPNIKCNCVAFSNDVAYCGAGYNDGTIRTFSLERVDLELKFTPHDCGVVQLMFSLDAHVIVSGNEKGIIVISSASAGSTLRVLTDHRGSTLTTMDMAPLSASNIKESIWLAGSQDRRITVWLADWVRDECELFDWLTYPAPPFVSDDVTKVEPPTLAKFTPSNPDVIVVATFARSPELIFHSVRQKMTLKKVTISAWAMSLDVSPSGHLIVYSTQNRLITLVDYEQGTFQDFIAYSDNSSTVKFVNASPQILSVADDSISSWKVHA